MTVVSPNWVLVLTIRLWALCFHRHKRLVEWTRPEHLWASCALPSYFADPIPLYRINSPLDVEPFNEWHYSSFCCCSDNFSYLGHACQHICLLLKRQQWPPCQCGWIFYLGPSHAKGPSICWTMKNCERSPSIETISRWCQWRSLD